MQNNIRTVLLKKLDKHDPETYLHSIRVGRYVKEIARTEGNYEPLTINDVADMGKLHDIGKLCVKPELLRLQSITEWEFKLIKRHTRKGYDLLRKDLPIAACAAGKHHPNYAVKAYPIGLTKIEKEVIDIYMPVVIICDFYDALMTRNNDAFIKIDKTNRDHVNSLLQSKFPDNESRIEMLLEHHFEQEVI